MSKYRVKVGEETIEVQVQDPTAHPVIATIHGQDFEVWIQEEEGPEMRHMQPLPAAPAASSAPNLTPSTPDPLAVAAQPRRMVAGGKTVRAPMPGLIIKVAVKPGDQVERGQILCVLEAMKMNNQIRAPQDGVVAEIQAEVGAQVNYGDPLATFE
jgi:biotin carboxyl carrier protein